MSLATDAEAGSETGDGFGKGHIVVLDEERNDVATRLTSEAMEDAAIGIDVEGGRFLFVERAEPLPASAGVLELHVAPDHADDVGSITHLVDRGFRDPTQSCPRNPRSLVYPLSVTDAVSSQLEFVCSIRSGRRS